MPIRHWRRRRATNGCWWTAGSRSIRSGGTPRRRHSYRAVLATTPRHVSARNNLALSLAVTGQYDEAVALLTPLARSSAATPRIRENLALIYGLMGDADRAAMLSRADLDDGSIRANMEFIAAVRGGRS